MYKIRFKLNLDLIKYFFQFNGEVIIDLKLKKS